MPLLRIPVTKIEYTSGTGPVTLLLNTISVCRSVTDVDRRQTALALTPGTTILVETERLAAFNTSSAISSFIANHASQGRIINITSYTGVNGRTILDHKPSDMAKGTTVQHIPDIFFTPEYIPTLPDQHFSTDYIAPLVVDTPGAFMGFFDLCDHEWSMDLISGVTNGTLTLDSDGSFIYQAKLFQDWVGTPLQDLELNGGTDSFVVKPYKFADVSNGPIYSNSATVYINVLAPGIPYELSPPTISNTADVGHTLTINNGSYKNFPTSYTYQWQISSDNIHWSDINGEIYSSYIVATNDLSHYLRVGEVATNATGSADIAYSAATSLVIDMPIILTAPTISGAAMAGATLTEHNGTYLENGSAISFTYQWQSSSDLITWNNISGATSQTYVVDGAYTSNYLRVAELATNAAGAPPLNYSTNTSIITGVPFELTLPTITGALGVGNILTESNGTYAGSPTGYTYQWQRSSNTTAWSDINGATSQTYQLDSNDTAKYIRVGEIASNIYGSNSTTYSAATGIVVNIPVNVSAPTINGSIVVGQTLTVSNGFYNGSPATYGYQWQTSANGTSGWTNITDAIYQTYQIALIDIGYYLRVVETASNAAGSAAPVPSAVSTVVIDNASIPFNTAIPTITGAVLVGETLTEVNGTYTGGVSSYSYQWQSSANGIDGWTNIIMDDEDAIFQTLVLTSDLLGLYMRVSEIASNAAGPAPAAYSAVTVTVKSKPISLTKPTIGGVVAVGHLLTETHAQYFGGVVSYTYQWQRSSNGTIWSDIPSATLQSYTLTPNDDLSYVRVSETATNASGTAAAVYSIATALVVDIPTSSAVPTIAGTTTVGQYLTESHGTYTQPIAAYIYQWQNSANGSLWANIIGATSQTYQLVSGDASKYVRVNETAINVAGSITTPSAATALIANIVIPPTNISPPTITGTAIVNQVLTESHGTYNGTSITYTYQWQYSSTNDQNAVWANIPAATNQTYQITSTYVSKYIRVAETAANTAGSVTTYSTSTSIVINRPVNTSPPTISGTAQVGQYLSENNGSYTGGVDSFAYQWQNSSDNFSWAAINGAITQTYQVANSDVSKYIRVGEIATNVAGSDAIVYSAPTTIVPAPLTAPVNTSLPTISGLAAAGLTLTEINGVYTGGVNSYAYQWQSSSDNSNWSPISGATSQSYLLVPGDVSKYIRVRETATNNAGSTTVYSVSTSRVLNGTPVITSFTPLTFSSTEIEITNLRGVVADRFVYMADETIATFIATVDIPSNPTHTNIVIDVIDGSNNVLAESIVLYSTYNTNRFSFVVYITNISAGDYSVRVSTTTF